MTRPDRIKRVKTERRRAGISRRGGVPFFVSYSALMTRLMILR